MEISQGREQEIQTGQGEVKLPVYRTRDLECRISYIIQNLKNYSKAAEEEVNVYTTEIYNELYKMKLTITFTMA